MSRSRKPLAAILSPVAFALLLTACGGGGGGSGNPAASGGPPPSPTPAPAQNPELLAGEELAKAMANGSLPLPSEHGIASGRIEIAAGAYKDLGPQERLRFSCTGSVACIVSVDGGQAQVVAGAVRLARLPAVEPSAPVAMPEPNPNPNPALWPEYLVMSAARLASLMGGSVLDWGNEEAMREMVARLNRDPNDYRRFGPTRAAADSRHTDALRPNSMSQGYVVPEYDSAGNIVYSVGYRPDTSQTSLFFVSFRNFNTVLDEFWRAEAVSTDAAGIDYVQMVGKDSNYPAPTTSPTTGIELTGDQRGTARILVGLLEYADFWVMDGTGILGTSGAPFNGPTHHAAYRVLRPDSVYLGQQFGYRPISGTWNGTLIGIGHDKAYPDLHGQPITGGVEISTDVAYLESGHLERANFDVEFTNIRKVNTGEAVSLSTMHWQRNTTDYSSALSTWLGSHHIVGGTTGNGTAGGELTGYNLDSEETDQLSVSFGGPEYNTAAGVFFTREAIGAFGAKKQ